MTDAISHSSRPFGRLALIADDEAPIRMVVGQKLRQAGFEVLDASDGQEAYEKARLRRPDIIITDLQMPYMSGIDLARQIAADPRTTGVPIVLLTARGYILESDALDRTSIKRLVPKPFSARELLALIEQVLAEQNSSIRSSTTP